MPADLDPSVVRAGADALADRERYVGKQLQEPGHLGYRMLDAEAVIRAVSENVECPACYDRTAGRSLGRIQRTLHDYRVDVKWEPCKFCRGEGSVTLIRKQEP